MRKEELYPSTKILIPAKIMAVRSGIYKIKIDGFPNLFTMAVSDNAHQTWIVKEESDGKADSL